MRLEEWKFSARLGLQDHWLRITSLLSLLVVLGMGAYVLFRLLPEGFASGVITMHYNVYLGIDDVRPWPWVFAIPGTALGLVVIDTLLALGLFRKHPMAARTVTSVGLAAAVVWAIGAFFLMLVNI